MAKAEKKQEKEEKVLYTPEVNEKVLFMEKYQKAGYKVTTDGGVLMFHGDYEMVKITKMLKEDGYVGSFGVTQGSTSKGVNFENGGES